VIGRRCGGWNDQLVPPLCPRRTKASRLHSTLSVCDPRIKGGQLPAALRGSVLFTRLLSFESCNIHFYRAVRQHTVLIAIFQYDWRAYRLHAREAQVWPPPFVSYFPQSFFSLVLHSTHASFTCIIILWRRTADSVSQTAATHLT